MYIGIRLVFETEGSLVIKINQNKLWCAAQQTPPPSIAASRGLPELTKNVIRSSHGHSTPSLKISCKSVQPFSRNLADKETKKEIARLQYPVPYRGGGGGKIMKRVLNMVLAKPLPMGKTA